MNEKDQKKLLDDVLSVVRKDFGKESVMLLGKEVEKEIKVLSTEIPSLDDALGIGGIPRGRVIELYGPESSGKSTLAMGIVAQAQKQGDIVAYIDAEHAMDPGYAKLLGVDVDSLIFTQPDNGEQGFDMACKLAETGKVGLIIVDSVAALVPKDEIEGNMDENKLGLQARMIGKGLRKLTPIASKTNTTVIFINQLRQKIGVMFGDPTVTPGGLALKFYSSIRMDIRKVEALKNGDAIIGNKVRVKVVKNKVAAPFKTAEFDIIFGKGIDSFRTMFENAVEKGIITRSGAYYNFGEIKLGSGKENSLDYIKNNKEIFEEIKQLI